MSRKFDFTDVTRLGLTQLVLEWINSSDGVDIDPHNPFRQKLMEKVKKKSMWVSLEMQRMEGN